MVKKILYIVHDGQLYGSQQSLLLILSRLSRLWFRPMISLARSGPLEVLLRQPQFDIPIFHHQRLMWFKHDVRNIFQQIGDAFALLLALPTRVRRLKNLICEHQIDLVHTNSVVSLEGALAAKWAKVPHVWHIRELFMEASPKLRPVLPRAFTRWLILSLSSQVVCISNAVRAQFPASDKISVLYNAVNLRDWTFETKALQAPLRLGYVGRITEGKRFHDLLAAMAKVPEATLRVAGNFVDVPYQNRIENQVTDLALNDRVEWLGYQQDIRAFFNTIDVLILPSLHEPFGRVLIEAMASGVLCIGAASGGIPEIITHRETGWLFPPGDTDQLAACLAEIQCDAQAAVKIAENAGRMVQDRFTIESQQEQLAEIYSQLLEGDLTGNQYDPACNNGFAHAKSTQP